MANQCAGDGFFYAFDDPVDACSGCAACEPMKDNEILLNVGSEFCVQGSQGDDPFNYRVLVLAIFSAKKFVVCTGYGPDRYEQMLIILTPEGAADIDMNSIPFGDDNDSFMTSGGLNSEIHVEDVFGPEIARVSFPKHRPLELLGRRRALPDEYR